MAEMRAGSPGRAKWRLIVTTMAVVVCALLLAIIVRGGSAVRFEHVPLPSMADVPDSAWDRLSQKKIYFGHQSVGYNIIAGIEDIMKTDPRIQLNIVETDDPDDLGVPILSHSKVGQNKYPKSKIEAFAANMDKGIAGKVDIAFFKFCYADVGAETYVTDVFSEYKRVMADLKTRYPDTIFVHVTVPLTSVQTGLKAGMKRLIGKPVYGYEDNPKRSQYNALLRQEYEGKEPLFDLAKVEATSPQGRRALFEQDGVTFDGMFPAHTYDGGHLTEQGRRAVAQQLLVLLAGLPE